MANELRLKLTTDITGFTAGLRTASAQLGTAVKTINAQLGGFAQFGSALRDFGFTGIASISAPIAAVGTAALSAAAKIETARIALVTLTRSSAEADRQLKAIQQFALTTPFRFDQVLEASRRMQALGFSSKETLPFLRQIGDTVSALGTGVEGMDRVILALGQIKQKGTLQSQEFRQLAEAGIPAWEALARTIGTGVPEAMKLVENRAISSEVAIQAIQTAMGRFAGGMEAQSKTLAGTWERFRESVFLVAADIGNTLAPTAQSFARTFAFPMLEQLKRLSAGFAQLPEPIRNTSLALAGLAAAAPVAVFALGQIAFSITSIVGVLPLLAKALPVITSIVSALAPWAAAMAAIAAVSYAGKKAWDEFVNSATKTKAAAFAGQAAAIQAQSGVANFTKAVVEAKVEADPAAQALADLKAKIADIGTASEDSKKKLKDFSLASMSLGNQASAIVEGERFHQSQEKILDILKQKIVLQREGWQLETDLAAALDSATRGALQRLSDSLSITKINAAGLAGILGEIVTIANQKAVLDIQLPGWLESGNLGGGDIMNLPSDNAGRAARELDKLRKIYKDATKGISDDTKRAMREVSTVFTDMSRDIARLIFEGGKFKDVMVDAAKQMGQALVRLVLQQALTPILNQITSILGKIPGLGKIFGAGSSAAGSAAGGIGSTGGLTQAISSSLGSVLTTVFSGISAISGVVGNFQNARQEGTLNAIEKETRYTQIHALNILEKLNVLLPNLAHIHERLMEIRTFGVGVFPQPGYAGIGGGSGTSIAYNHYGNVYGGPAGIRELTNEIVAELRKLGVKFG